MGGKGSGQSTAPSHQKHSDGAEVDPSPAIIAPPSFGIVPSSSKVILSTKLKLFRPKKRCLPSYFTTAKVVLCRELPKQRIRRHHPVVPAANSGRRANQILSFNSIPSWTVGESRSLRIQEQAHLGKSGREEEKESRSSNFESEYANNGQVSRPKSSNFRNSSPPTPEARMRKFLI
ncbi:hypothetical protein RJT34_04413 [Clitoria ternatea]|uniref:Uncharacterized protein n=1 Tax=Clitoria ternatea TaxID=43366 RepID=A0AAN9KPN3_CLITE